MGLLGILGEAARESYDSFKKDPAGNISNAMYSMNDKYERKKDNRKQETSIEKGENNNANRI